MRVSEGKALTSHEKRTAKYYDSDLLKQAARLASAQLHRPEYTIERIAGS
jgi:hypothetical protein